VSGSGYVSGDLGIRYVWVWKTVTVDLVLSREGIKKFKNILIDVQVIFITLGREKCVVKVNVCIIL